MHVLLHSVSPPCIRPPMTHASAGDSWTLAEKYLACSMPKARGGIWEEPPHTRGQGWRPRGATPHPRSGGCMGAGGPREATTCSRSGGAVVRRYPSSKVRGNGCALLEQRKEIGHIQGKRKASKTVGSERGHQRADIVQETGNKTIPKKK